MDKLAHEFFKRDLTSDEEMHLEALVLEDAGAAETLAREAARRFPDPSRLAADGPVGTRGYGPWAWGAGLVLALAAGFALAWLPVFHTPILPGAEVRWNAGPATAPMASGRLGFARRPSKPVAVELTLQRAELVIVSVVDSQGRTLRVLKAGRLGAGTHNLSWDRRDGEGSPVDRPGWTVRVEEGLPLGEGGR